MSARDKFRKFKKDVKKLQSERSKDLDLGSDDFDVAANSNLLLDLTYGFSSDSNHLKYSQDFSEENDLHLYRKLNYRQCLRVFCLVMLAIGYALNLAAWPLYEQYTMFSNWTMHFTTISIVLTFRAARS